MNILNLLKELLGKSTYKKACLIILTVICVVSMPKIFATVDALEETEENLIAMVDRSSIMKDLQILEINISGLQNRIWGLRLLIGYKQATKIQALDLEMMENKLIKLEEKRDKLQMQLKNIGRNK